MSYHDSNPVHHVRDGFSLKREGDTIIVYPGAIPLTLSEWASAVAFTSTEGESGPLHHAILALLDPPAVDAPPREHVNCPVCKGVIGEPNAEDSCVCGIIARNRVDAPPEPTT